MPTMEELNKICERFEYYERAIGINILIRRGYGESNAIKYYNIWRENYIQSYNTEACRTIKVV